MWERYWKLSRDPFLSRPPSYVETPGHDEAVARIVQTIESGQPLATLRAGEGLGKSVVAARALAETRSPRRRVARVVGPLDGVEMLETLAAGLGATVRRGGGRAAAWNALTTAVRLCRLQKLHAVLVVEDAHVLHEPAGRLDLERLPHVDPSPTSRLTVVQTFRDPPRLSHEADLGVTPRPWQLSIRLNPLTLSETGAYVARKLDSAGRAEPAFTPRALARLYELTGGVPRGIDRLASLSLMAAAVRGQEIATPDVITAAVAECETPLGLHAA